MQLFKTKEEKEAEKLKKERDTLNEKIKVLEKEPMTYIKQLFENEGIEVLKMEKEYDDIRVEIPIYNSYKYIPLQVIAVETGYFVVSYHVYGKIVIDFSTYQIMKQRESNRGMEY